MPYVWQSPHWPRWHWDAAVLLKPLADIRRNEGRLQSLSESLDETDRLHLAAQLLTDEAVATSAIEGVTLPPDVVRAAVDWQLGLGSQGSTPPHSIESLVQLLAAARQTTDALTENHLFAWHGALLQERRDIRVGQWRKDTVRVISQKNGTTTLHFEAPPANQVPSDMAQFLRWWNVESRDLDGVMRAALAHLWFVTVHPFEDGNGRLARVLTDLAVAEDLGSRLRFLSLSPTILARRSSYYDVLETVQRGCGDCTEWFLWFFSVFDSALSHTASLSAVPLFKIDFIRRHQEHLITPRQRKVIQRLLAAGPEGLADGLTTRTYQKLTGASRATAWREIEDLVSRGMLRLIPGARGRSTAYELPWPDDLPTGTAYKETPEGLHPREFFFRLKPDYFFSPSLAI